MTIDWQRFLNALGDFVTIMMPGMIAVMTLGWYFSDIAFLGLPERTPLSLSLLFGTVPEINVASWLVFLVASYLAGHIVFLLGSFLDGWLYDPVRQRTSLHFRRALAKGKAPPIGGTGAHLARAIFGNEPDKAVIVAERLKALTLGTPDNYSSMNSYKWCKVRLLTDSSEGYAQVLRFEADSKFFRSLLIIVPILVVTLWQPRLWFAGLSIGLSLLIVWRYFEQRFKATEEAYTQIINLDAGELRQWAEKRDGDLAGAVVYRRARSREQRKDEIRYLLVQAKLNANEWVFPKGHVELGETERETAVREAFEETGVWGRVVGYLDRKNIGDPPRLVPFYLLEHFDPPGPHWILACVFKPFKRGLRWLYLTVAIFIRKLRRRCEGRKRRMRTKLWPENRKHEWLAYEAACAQAGFNETRELLMQVAVMVRDPAVTKRA